MSKQKIIILGMLGVTSIVSLTLVANIISGTTMNSQAGNVKVVNYSSSISSTITSISSQSSSSIVTQVDPKSESSSSIQPIEIKIESPKNEKITPEESKPVILKVEPQSSFFEPEKSVEYSPIQNPSNYYVSDVRIQPIIEPEPEYTPPTPQKPIPEVVIQSNPEPIYEALPPEPTPEPTPPPVINNNNVYSDFGCVTAPSQQMLELVNQHRINNGVGTLRMSSDISGVACAHSKWMNSTGNFSHTGVNGSDPFQRCERAGTSCNAENVAFNTSGSIIDLFNQFKGSPGHNANMLDGSYTEVGIGFENIYVTQDFR
jgi:uncharacterized protein YkwD